MIHDLLFEAWAKNHNMSESALLDQATILYFTDHPERQTSELDGKTIHQIKRHFLNKQETFRLDLNQPCKPARTGHFLKRD